MTLPEPAPPRRPSLAGLSGTLSAVLLAALAVLLIALGISGRHAEAPGPAVQGPPRDALTREIGQMLMLGFRGQGPGEAGPRRVAGEIREGLIGGVLLLGDNIGSRRQLEALTRALRPAGDVTVPLIAVDQEGGAIQRLRPAQGFQRYPSAAGVSRTLDAAGAKALYTGLARELASVGINLNLGPVVDLDRNRRNRIIGGMERSYGSDPARVTLFARAFVEAHREAGVLTAAKHFPGHGSSTADSHAGFVDIGRTWSPAEIEPYKALVGPEGVPMVMVGHLYLPALGEGRQLPATLSRRAIGDMLRHSLGFQGVVITDDMEMGAIRQNFGLEESTIAAINAGNDILIYSNISDDASLVPRLHAVIRRAVETGRIPRGRVAEAFGRIQALKATIGHPAAPALSAQPVQN